MASGLVDPNAWEVARAEAHERIQELLRDRDVDDEAMLRPGREIAFGDVDDAAADLWQKFDEAMLRPGRILHVPAGEDPRSALAPVAGIGDVNSDARGSGARYNAHKVPYRFIPARILADWMVRRFDMYAEADMLRALANFEERQATAFALLGALSVPHMEEGARVFQYGAAKYAAWNWAKGMPWSVPIECAKRHIVASLGAIDKESGYTHAGHVACNFIMLAHYERYYPEGDDRPPGAIFHTLQGTPK